MISIRSSAFSTQRSTVVAGAKRHLRRFKSTVTSEASSGTTATAAESSNSSAGVPIAASLAAAVAGVGVVGAAAFVVERATAGSCLPYSNTNQQQQRFDQETFGGRFARMLLACDPILLLHGEAKVRAAQERLRDAANTATITAFSAEESRSLWESKRIVEGAVHPDTGEFIPRPFRMSGYVPYNGPICVSMVASTSTVPLLFWSWINQSQNALVNYYNRNASSPMTNETLLKSYSAAVGSALVVAFGLSTFVQKRYPAARAKQLMKYVAFPSAVVASSLNCYVVRSPEIDTGVPLMDRNGKLVEMDYSVQNDNKDSHNDYDCDCDNTNSSRIAARRGVESTTASRALLQAPVYFLPSLLMGVLPPLKSFLEKHPRTRVPVTTFMVLVSFGLGLPATIAIFPQVAEIKASDAEPKYQRLIDPDTQRPYEAFYYNKGL
mmetsp:Transcript_25782/g.56556  ORF Transcript_25782/g.56556 Transcript_25782/m.56556 type:complete len:437 (-) Transcript_25782:167-1477(-)|eukprot:CAMPEP_0168178262 /NCGR_PEP_ID=MMETSP0139_2-20121125/8998_1 /TAXON_ID=44445 /ORGANISM="Pseudo-nitzschia australis, Strain 10249 10 AB" /LENGTH=436 /DNA_ID=CAMNT_0008097577 /DNA_START=326 /DNA_END=1636 /DNA_ORIENTATION=+